MKLKKIKRIILDNKFSFIMFVHYKNMIDISYILNKNGTLEFYNPKTISF